MTSTPPEIKARLRVDGLAARRALTPAQVAAASTAMCHRLQQLEAYQRARLIHIYVASKDNEVETAGLIRQSLDSGRAVAVPVVRPGTRVLRHALIQDLDQLQPGRWGLFEPTADHSSWLEDLDLINLVVVPGLAFDRRGNRLGLGGGYYDRFLARVEGLKAGLIYHPLLRGELPAEPHDIPMDLVVTEAAAYCCAEERGISPHEPTQV
ncbi:MAG: 5-formyltetrahydrofolate cyclo-ligase [Candidatus Latescibacteria bacterium]|nr:5-formyltetrahydrofolate cyclo-ligase [Candidatus Latescibacterota bacterium]